MKRSLAVWCAWRPLISGPYILLKNLQNVAPHAADASIAPRELYTLIGFPCNLRLLARTAARTTSVIVYLSSPYDLSDAYAIQFIN